MRPLHAVVVGVMGLALVAAGVAVRFREEVAIDEPAT
jgi:hypothetical protein